MTTKVLVAKAKRHNSTQQRKVSGMGEHLLEPYLLRDYSTKIIHNLILEVDIQGCGNKMLLCTEDLNPIM